LTFAVGSADLFRDSEAWDATLVVAKKLLLLSLHQLAKTLADAA
jgi:hypothetical protein